jgi:predicted RNA-binding Zn-ribbon protein involved in translation (DUF1610 family)
MGGNKQTEWHSALQLLEPNVNWNSPKTLLNNYPALQTWLKVILVIWLLSLIGLGGLVKSVLVVLGLLILAPVVVALGFYWWFQRNLIQSACPVCQFELAGINGTQTQCPQCGEPLQVQDNKFTRLTPPGTIDVQAVEVSAQVVDE